MQGSSFEPCPLCSKAIPSALLTFHVNSCLAAASGNAKTISQQEPDQQPQPHAESSAPAACTSAPVPPVDPHTQDSQLGIVADVNATDLQQAGTPNGGTNLCVEPANIRQTLVAPLNQQVLNASGASAAAAFSSIPPAKHPCNAAADNASDPRHSQQTQIPLVEHDAAGQQSASQQASQQGPAQAQPKAAKRSNAFAHMMQKQKERSQTWTFYLGKAEDGGLFWHMWREVKGGNPLPDLVTQCSGEQESRSQFVFITYYLFDALALLLMPIAADCS